MKCVISSHISYRKPNTYSKCLKRAGVCLKIKRNKHLFLHAQSSFEWGLRKLWSFQVGILLFPKTFKNLLIVPFSIQRLYGDDALDNALNTYVKLLLSIPQSDLLDYPKLSQTYYVLLECLAQDHISFLATMEPQVFMYILSSISEGLTALGANLNYFTGISHTQSKREIFLPPSFFQLAPQ